MVLHKVALTGDAVATSVQRHTKMLGMLSKQSGYPKACLKLIKGMGQYQAI